MIHGVNEVGYESGNPQAVDSVDQPWLQDVPEVDVWGAWGIVFRDVVILDADNQVRDVYNLTDHDLSDPAAYDELKGLLAP